jgi:hypothetical protein
MHAPTPDSPPNSALRRDLCDSSLCERQLPSYTTAHAIVADTHDSFRPLSLNIRFNQYASAQMGRRPMEKHSNTMHRNPRS